MAFPCHFLGAQHLLVERWPNVYAGRTSRQANLGVSSMTDTFDRLKEVLALRPRDAAKALSISPRHLWQLTRDGVIPSVKLHRTVLYRPEALAAWLAASERKGGAER